MNSHDSSCNNTDNFEAPSRAAAAPQACLVVIECYCSYRLSLFLLC